MWKKQDRPLHILAAFFVLLLIVTASANFINKIHRNVLVSILSIFNVIIPFVLSYIAEKKNITLPNHFKASLLVFFFSTQYLGELVGFYYTLWWWDLLLHGFAGMYAVVLGLWLTRGIIDKKEGVTIRCFYFFITFFAFCFSTTISTLWEAFEFACDILLKTNMLQEGLKDTFDDLIAGIALAFITSAVYYLKAKNSTK